MPRQAQQSEHTSFGGSEVLPGPLAGPLPGPLVGPNAAIQVANVLRDGPGEFAARTVFKEAALEHWLDAPPTEMILQGQAIAVHQALHSVMPAPLGDTFAAQAGARTGEYILARRIPPLAKGLLRALPSSLALPLLLKAITAHAWTFAGSGAFSAKGREIEIKHNPLALTPSGCCWHKAVFETLFRDLVSPHATVTEHTCCARGAYSCLFEVSFHAIPAPAIRRPAASTPL